MFSISRMREFCSKYLSKYVFMALVLVFVVGSVAYFGNAGPGNAREKEKQGQEAVAVVNGKTISKADLDAAMQMTIDRGGAGAYSSPIERADLTVTTLQQLIQQKLQVSAAEQAGVSIGMFERSSLKNKIIDSEIEQVRQMMSQGSKMKLSDDELNKRLAIQNPPTSLAKIRQDMDTQLTDDTLKVYKLEEQLKAKAGNVSDAQLQSVFEKVKERHILVRANSANDPKAESKARKILEMLKGGADFATLAKQNSDDTMTRDKGGEFPMEISPMQDPDVAGLKKGQTSDVIKSASFQGYRIIQVEDVKTQLPADFAVNKSKYREAVKANMLDKQAIQQFYTNAQKNERVDVKDPEIQAYLVSARVSTIPDPNTRKIAAPQAIAALLKIAKSSPNQAGVHSKLAQMYMAVGDDAKALSELEYVTDTARAAGSDLSLMKAQLYIKKNDIVKAKKELETAGNIGYGDYSIHSQLKDLYLKIGDKEASAKEQKWMDDMNKRREAMQPQPKMTPAKPADAKKPATSTGG